MESRLEISGQKWQESLLRKGKKKFKVHKQSYKYGTQFGKYI